MQFNLNWPNLITIVRVLMIPLFVMAIMQVTPTEVFFRMTALIIFVLMVLGDGLDGLMARRLRQRTVMGAFLDPLGDKLMMFSAYIFLAAACWPEPRVPRWVSTVVISRDLLMGIGFATLFVVSGRFRMVSPSGVGKLCTAVQAATITYVLGAPWMFSFLGTSLGQSVLIALGLLTVFMTLFSGVDYLYAARVYFTHGEQVGLTVEHRPGKE